MLDSYINNFKIPPRTSLVEYYKILRMQDHPANVFKRFLAEGASKSTVTVTNWFSGKYPDALTQRVIAEMTGSTPEDLFPPKSESNQSNNSINGNL